MHSVAYHMNKKFNLNKDVRKLFFFDINILFSSLCYVFKSRSISAKVKTPMNTLELYIRYEYFNSTYVSHNLEEEDSNNSIATKDSKTFKEKSHSGDILLALPNFAKMILIIMLQKVY